MTSNMHTPYVYALYNTYRFRLSIPDLYSEPGYPTVIPTLSHLYLTFIPRVFHTERMQKISKKRTACFVKAQPERK